MNLQTLVPTYTVFERALGLHKITTDVFEWNKSSDCVTPIEIAQKQFASCTTRGTVCIPGAGIGTYVVAALQVGFKPEDITAVELNPAYFELGSAIYQRFGVNYVLADFLEWNPQMQFDVIVGNPPYSLPKGDNTLSKGKNLAIRFIEKSAELLAEGGYVSMVTPYNFLKPVNSSRPSQRYKAMEGLSLLEVETGAERTWFPNIGTKICVWWAQKGGRSDTISLNGCEWNLDEIPFIVDLAPEELDVFQRLWKHMKAGGNPVSCAHIKDGNQLPQEGWSMTERVNRRYGKEFIIPWGPEPVREKYEQIHISLTPGRAKELFSQLHVRFFVKATSIEPTVYHHLFNGLDFGPLKITEADQEIMTTYLDKP
jgi:hypothetical protein